MAKKEYLKALAAYRASLVSQVSNLHFHYAKKGKFTFSMKIFPNTPFKSLFILMINDIISWIVSKKLAAVPLLPPGLLLYHRCFKERQNFSSFDILRSQRKLYWKIFHQKHFQRLNSCKQSPPHTKASFKFSLYFLKFSLRDVFFSSCSFLWIRRSF